MFKPRECQVLKFERLEERDTPAAVDPVPIAPPGTYYSDVYLDTVGAMFALVDGVLAVAAVPPRPADPTGTPITADTFLGRPQPIIDPAELAPRPWDNVYDAGTDVLQGVLDGAVPPSIFDGLLPIIWVN